MRRVLGSLLLSTLCGFACLPPRTVSQLGPSSEIGLLVAPAKGGHQFAVTLERPAYLMAVEVILNQGARVVATSTGSEPVAPGQHAFTLLAHSPAINGATTPLETTAAGPMEPCPLQPFYEEVRSGDSTRIVFNASLPTRPETAPLMCNSLASHPLTALSPTPPDRYVLVIASSERITIERAGQWLADESAQGGVRDVLDRIARGVASPATTWSAAAFRVL